jgi:hypothetical protein
MSKYSRSSSAVIAAACLIVGAGPAWATVCAAPVPGGSGDLVQRFHRQDDNRWLVETRHGLLLLGGAGLQLQAFSGPVLDHVSHLVPVNRDTALAFNDREGSPTRGVFRVDKTSLKIQELSGSEALRFTAVARMAGGGAVVGTDRGLYRADPSGQQFQEVSGPDTGRVSLLEPIDESGWLVGAASGLFRADGRALRADRVPGGETGEVTTIQRLADGAWLIGSERGLFRADASGRNLTALAARKPIRVAEIHKAGDGAWLVRADQGLFLADGQGRRLEPLDEETTSAWRIHHGDERGALLQNKRLLYALPAGAKKPEFLTGEPINDILLVRAVQDGWLVATRRGIFRVDLQRRRFVPLKGPAIGRIVSLNPLKTGAWLVASEAGLFRTDPGLQSIEPMPGAAPGAVFAARPLAQGAFLVGAAHGLFRIDAEGQGASAVPGGAQADVWAIERLESGSWLAIGRNGVAAVDADGHAMTPVLGALGGRGVVAQPLPDGRALLGTSQGLLATGASLSDAETTVIFDRPFATGQLRHACSSTAEHMNLVVEATREGEAAPGKRTPARIVRNGSGAADFTAELGSLPPGRWALRLVSTANGKDVAVGKAETVSVGPGAGQWLGANWLWLLVGLGAVQTLAFGGLVGVSRWRSWPLRMLRPAWTKALVWPALLLPHAWSLQKWTLSSWFMTMRDGVPADLPLVETAVTSRDGTVLKQTELLARLATARRIWLQGRSGMGKSIAFAAWKQAFFGAHASLSGAAKQFGFILLPVSSPVALRIEGRDHPVRSILRIAEASLQQGGIPCDEGVLRGMLRSGRLALAFDAPDRALRDAIAEFGRAYPKARLIVTSEHAAQDAFEAWQLPARLSQTLVEPLLQLWLGAYSGSRLTGQLEREDVLPHLATCYDVKLVADLVTDDPKQVLPTDRISLYRALFARAAARDDALRDLAGLKSLAWTMTLEGRSRMAGEELAPLDQGRRDILISQGTRVLRRSGEAYAFDHDQLRFLLAAECLVESNRPVSLLIRALENSPVWACDRAEQEEFWRFVSALLSPEEVTALWRFSLEDPERVFLQCALHKHGVETKIFPIGLAAAMSARDEGAAPRLRTVEA